MKSFAAKEKRSAPAVRKAGPYVHYPMGPVQRAQQVTMRKILRPDEVQAKPDINDNDSKYEQETDHAVADLHVPAISGIPRGGLGGAPPIQRSENEEPEEELQRQPDEEEEELVQTKLIQMQPDDEEEEEPVQARLIQRKMADMHGIRPSRFGNIGSRVKAHQAEIRRILRSTGAQAKLTIGAPNDKYEHEADRVADQVMAMPDLKLQRQPENEEEEETLQTKPLADQITPLVQRQEEPPEEEEEPVQAKFKDGEMLQRMCPECEQETAQRQPMEEEEEEIQTKTKPGETPAVASSIESRINSLKGGGQPLDSATRNFFEPRFGHDFSNVRIHIDSDENRLATKLGAEAFTVGRGVYFGRGRYNPRSIQGKKLLGHELAHVVQQSKNNFPQIHRKATWRSPVLNRRNAAEVFYYSKALMGSPAGMTTLVVNGNDIRSNVDLMSAIPQPSIDSKARSDGSIICWFKNSVNATANTRLDIFTRPPWKFALPTSEVAKKYSRSSQCQAKTGNTVIRARDWYNKDAKLEQLIHMGELEHNKADRGVFNKFISKYVANVNKHLGPKKGHVVSGSKTAKSSDCIAKLRNIENRQLLTDMVIAMNKANAHIHRNNRHEVSVFGIIINKNCSRVLIQVIPPNL